MLLEARKPNGDCRYRELFVSSANLDNISRLCCSLLMSSREYLTGKRSMSVRCFLEPDIRCNEDCAVDKERIQVFPLSVIELNLMTMTGLFLCTHREV